MSDETIWKKLTRLFRSGPVVRHKVAAGERLYEPSGTASAYKRELSSIYVHSLASYGQYERLARYADYSEMLFTPELAQAMNIYADEVTCESENGHVVEIISKNEEIKETLETLFYEILNIDFNAWGWVKTLCKNGDFILFVDASEENGILNLLPIPINEIEREEGYDKEDPFAVRFRWLTHGNAILQNWQVVHFRLLGDDSYLPYGTSLLESARRIWRQLILIEDAMLVYRIVRSPERRVFYIDVGNIPAQDMDRHIETIKTNLNRSTIVDQSTGRVDLRYNPLSVDENYYIPKRGAGDSSRIETLPGGQFTGDIEDVQYIQSKMFSAIGIPRAYLGYEEGIGSKATLAQEDVRFAKTIERIQKLFVAELNKIAIIHLYLLGFRGEDLVNFTIQTASPSTIATQQRLELWRMKLEIAGLASEGILDKETIYKRIFNLNDEQIAKIREGRKLDKLEDVTIEAIQAPQEEAPPGAAPEEPVPGEEELPGTLGGEAGGGAPPAPPENASFNLQGMILGEDEDDEDSMDEKYNPGSEGDDALIATDKGKNLFDPAEDLSNHAFGTEKQTASDPFDKRASRRLITRPFSESTDDVDEWFNRAIELVDLFELDDDIIRRHRG